MAVIPLSMAESLRPWRLAGMTHLLMEACGEAGADVQDLAQIHPQTKADEPYGSHEPSACPNMRLEQDASARNLIPPTGAENPPQPLAALSSQRPASVVAEKETSHPYVQGVVSASLPGTPSSPTAKTTESRSSVSLGWPPLWREALQRTKPAPLVWTYPELGRDLFLPPDEDSTSRSAFLRTLIGSLLLPKGTSTFWPVRFDFSALSLPRAEEGRDLLETAAAHAAAPPPDHTYFQAGLSVLQPGAVILFGLESLRATGLGLPLTTFFTFHVHSGILFVLLPGIDAFLPNPQLRNQCSIFLRSALTRILDSFEQAPAPGPSGQLP